jgi:hypothetical protein
MIMLAGIVVNNAILLVEFIEHYRHERDVPMEEAVVEAGAVRMRPILMTTVTSVMGSMPLALGLGAGGELMRPLAIAVVGGLICSTLLTLFVVPCAYILIQRGGERVKVFLVGDRKAAAVSGRWWRDGDQRSRDADTRAVGGMCRRARPRAALAGWRSCFDVAGAIPLCSLSDPPAHAEVWDGHADPASPGAVCSRRRARLADRPALVSLITPGSPPPRSPAYVENPGQSPR